MIYKVYLFSLMLTYLLTITEPAKILAALPNPMVSHQMVFQVLTQELSRRGHEVTVITGFPIYPKGQSPTNYIEIDVSEVANKIRTNVFLKEMKISDLFSQFVTTFKAISTLIDVLEMKVIQDLIRDKSNYFDLLILEDCVKSTLFFSHLFKAPVIEISSFGGTFETFEIVGAATHPLIYPLAIRKRYSDLSVWDKLSEFHMEYRLHKAYYAQRIEDDKAIKKYFGSNSPTIEDLKKNINLVFLNIHPIWDSNRPVPPNVIYLGGLHQKPEQELPKDLKTALDSSTNGVIYVSFGTNIGSEILSPERLQIFIKAFAKLSYDIYWKWNDNNLPGLSENVKVLKWLPQADILRHPKVKLFITQGGLQSTDEAIVGGVPLIGIPMMWDQWLNVDKYVQLKIGLQLDINTVSESNLIQAIETVIENKSYKENIIKLHSVMSDREQSPLQRAVWWTEYILRHRGADHLRAPSANMTWMEYYDVGLVLFIFISFIVIVGIFVFATFSLLRILVHKSKLD